MGSGQASILPVTQTETGGENIAFTANIKVNSAPAPKRKYCDRKEAYAQLEALVPTIGLHETEHDCKRIAKLVKCGLNTVKRFHKKYLKESESAALASSALVAAGSSAPARAWVGGSGGAGAAPCGWSAPPAQVILTIVAAHPRLSRHTRSPLLAAPLPGGNGDFEKITPVAGSRPSGGRSAPPH
jgi:hypothetical protein